MSADARVRELGLEVPDYANPPYGRRFGAMKPFHRVGNLLELSGMCPESRTGELIHPGVVSVDVTVAQAKFAARYTAINMLGMIRYALGSLDEVAGMSRALCFVVCPPGFDQLHEVSNGVNELFIDVFGPEIGSMGRASIGATSLSNNHCFELWLSLECQPTT